MTKMCGVSSILCMWAVSLCLAALPPDPDNAALLYYQAFLLRPEPDDATKALIDRVVNGGEPNALVREYLQAEECRRAIQYAEKAAQLRDSDWGPWYSLGFRCAFPHLASARFLSRILHVDARVLAADGQYLAAFERCLTIRKLAKHIDTETAHSYAMGTDFSAQRCISQILGSMPPDVETITWLKSQLVSVAPVSRSIARAAQMDLKMALQTARVDDSIMEGLRRELVEAADSKSTADIRSLSNEELLARIRKPYMEFLDSALQVIANGLPYEETYAEIEKLKDALRKEVNNPVAASIADILSMPSCYTAQVRYEARLAALSVALELYLEKAKTGRLPEQLPAGLPKDAYSGEDFIYTITEDGFTLRSRVQPADGGETLRLEYKTR
jgi:hypothetical protein